MTYFERFSEKMGSFSKNKILIQHSKPIIFWVEYIAQRRGSFKSRVAEHKKWYLNNK